jgi:integrase
MRLCIPSSKEITARSRREVSGKREGWTPEECEALFATPLYTSGPKEPDDALYWAPLISAHCGAREEEILQLLGSDVDGRWIRFRITRPEAQSIKSEASVRKVPMHSNLVALGLPELARRAGSGRIFPAVSRSAARGKLSETFTKRFIYYRRKYLGHPWNLPNKVFHSFRGGASTALLRAKVPLETVQQIVGHDSDDVTIVYYYDGDTEAMLRDAVEKIRIDVSGVKRLFG